VADWKAHARECHQKISELMMLNPSIEAEKLDDEFARLPAVITLHARCAKTQEGEYRYSKAGNPVLARINMAVHSPFFQDTVWLRDGTLYGGDNPCVMLGGRSYMAPNDNAKKKVKKGDRVNVDIVAASFEDRNRIKVALAKAMKDGFQLKGFSRTGDPEQDAANNFFSDLAAKSDTSTKDTSKVETPDAAKAALGG
jgi:hypothetical protein